MLQILAQEQKGGSNVKRLQQEITKYAVGRWDHISELSMNAINRLNDTIETAKYIH